jgi:hypothetical protein
MRLARSVSGVAAVLAGVGLTVLPSAMAKSSTMTWHWFQKAEGAAAFTDASGNPLGQNFTPAVGDVFDSSDVDYRGNGKHHAKSYDASDHIRCVLTAVAQSGFTAVCDAEIAVGGSLLLADHVTATFTNTGATVPISGGTGKYRGYHGTAVSKDIGTTNNSNFTVTIHR